VVLGPRTKIAYFDQQRLTLDEEATVAENVWHDEWVQLAARRCGSRTTSTICSSRADAAAEGEGRSQVGSAIACCWRSSSCRRERARARRADNDLDLVTLNVLEALLVKFTGAVLVVTHDRYFLDKVATSVLAVEATGR